MTGVAYWDYVVIVRNRHRDHLQCGLSAEVTIALSPPPPSVADEHFVRTVMAGLEGRPALATAALAAPSVEQLKQMAAAIGRVGTGVDGICRALAEMELAYAKQLAAASSTTFDCYVRPLHVNPIMQVRK